jgi:hypothetical protein
MGSILRLLWLICLLPGLATGVLPLPGQAAGQEMVICAGGTEHVIRVGADGVPIEQDEGCALCCAACGPAPALLPDPVLYSRAPASPAARVRLARALILPARAALFPAPRGPPAEKI